MRTRISNPPTVALAAATAATLFASTAHAEDVTLVFSDSDLTLVGELIKMDDAGYLILTAMGEIHVPASMVTCEGAGCDAAPASAES